MRHIKLSTIVLALVFLLVGCGLVGCGADGVAEVGEGASAAAGVAEEAGLTGTWVTPSTIFYTIDVYTPEGTREMYHPQSYELKGKQTYEIEQAGDCWKVTLPYSAEGIKGGEFYFTVDGDEMKYFAGPDDLANGVEPTMIGRRVNFHPDDARSSKAALSSVISGLIESNTDDPAISEVEAEQLAAAADTAVGLFNQLPAWVAPETGSGRGYRYEILADVMALDLSEDGKLSPAWGDAVLDEAARSQYQQVVQPIEAAWASGDLNATLDGAFAYAPAGDESDMFANLGVVLTGALFDRALGAPGYPKYPNVSINLDKYLDLIVASGEPWTSITQAFDLDDTVTY